ncbi:MAG: hypothetical protein QOJ90_344 [Actinomycetota bacterium]|jgi:uncharacterized protein (TIGR03086 family)|nr:hypothetical protein [Actinomycetota bacterium]
MTDIDVLETVLEKDADLLAAVPPDTMNASTACPEYDVRTLVNHIVGWAQVFAASAAGRTSDSDPTSYESKRPAAEFQTAADELVRGWREGGVDRQVRLSGPELPGQMVLSMTLMEYVTHGCDLALATGQPVPFSDDELEAALDHAKKTLPEEYRGPGKAFGPEIEVPEDSSALDRLLGFMGRRPPKH